MLKLNIQRFAVSQSISCSEIGRDIANNRTTQRITFTVTRTSGSTFWEANPAKKLNFTCDGQKATIDFNFPSSAKTKSAYYDFVVQHDSNGQKTISYSASIATGTSAGTITASGQTIIATIPRATACPSLSGDIEDSYTIPLNPANSGFTHSLHVSFLGTAGYINASGILQAAEYKFSNTNILFTIPASFYNNFSGKSEKGNFTLYTYNGNDKIGTTYGTLTASCSESRCKPSISGTVKDSNTITKALTGNENKLVKYFSNALLTLTLKAATSSGDTKSTVATRSADGTTFSGTSITLNKVSKKDFTITVTNSRGFSTSSIISASDELINYFLPSIVIDTKRYPDQTSSQVKLTYKGSFFNQSFGLVSNTIMMKWYWRKSTESDWTIGGVVTPTLNGNTISENTIDCGEDFNYQNAYRFKLEIVDKLTNAGTKEQDVKVGYPNFAFGRDWFKHFTKVLNQNGLRIDEPYPVGSIYLSVNSTHPSTLFGGTWEQIKDKFLFACSDIHKNGTAGGSKKHSHTLENGSALIGSPGGNSNALGFVSTQIGTLSDSTYSVGGNSNNAVGHPFRSHNTKLDGRTGDGDSMPPYLAVYIWKRIA